jgi:hypothetical protein
MWNFLPSWMADPIARLFAKALEQYGVGHVFFVILVLLFIHLRGRDFRYIIRMKDAEIKRLVEERDYLHDRLLKDPRHSALGDRDALQVRGKKK